MESKLLIILILLTVSILGLLLCKKEIKPPTTTTTSSTTTSISTSTTISPRNQECYDSDGGKNYYVKGTINIAGCFSDPETGATSCYSSEPINDTCIDNNRLKEYYCEDDSIKHINYTCPKECKDGKCIENIQLIVKDTYKQGEDIEIKVKNNMNESIYYNANWCEGPFYHIWFLNNSNQWVDYSNNIYYPFYTCPNCVLCMIEKIEPNETKEIGTWGQRIYYDINYSNQTYKWKMAELGKYKISFDYYTYYNFDYEKIELKNKTSIEKEFEII